MKVYIVNNKKISKYNLPLELEEFFSIEYQLDNKNDKFNITFSSNEQTKKWCLKSNGTVNVISNNNIVEEVELNNFNCYQIKILGIDDLILVYAIPTQENELYSLVYSNDKSITIGKNPKCNICYNNSLINDEHAYIEYKENTWIIRESENVKVGVYLNDKRISYTKLKYGDIIFINGLKIVWMPNNIKINNPNKQIQVAGMQPYVNRDDANNQNTSVVTDEEATTELYKEDDYFYHIPRIKEAIEEEQVNIDAPPECQLQEEVPFILTIGSSLTLFVSAFVTGFSAYNNYQANNNFLAILPQILMLIAMLIGSILMPKLLRNYQKKKLKKREALRQTKYKEYLETKQKEIERILKHQSDILIQNNDSSIKCMDIIKNSSRNLWNREIPDDDFLTVSLGTGNTEASLVISAPEEHFTLDKDELFESVYQVVNNSKMLKNVPITFSFAKNNISSFIFNCSYKDNYINDIMTKLITFHSGADLKIVILTNKSKENFWSYAKVLPHCWNDERNVRFFATDDAELNEVSSYLDDEFKKRKDGSPSGAENDKKDSLYKNFSTYYLLITDDYPNIKNSQIILDILKSDANYGFSLITLADSMKFLPNRCEKFIQISEKNSCILSKELNSKSQKEFVNDQIPNIDMEELSVKLANIPLMPKDGLKMLPTMLSFLEMFNVSKIEQLNIMNRWQTNNPVTSLATTIGVHSDLEPFKLDLHEKFHGPHGLIAGSTGSGKSEFIITYILSMAVNYHPYEVQFVLIDYKGGGLAGAFKNNETGVEIPHLIGTITNLDTSEMNRTLVSIDSELKRRQRIFNETKDALGESTIDIYKYQRLYREGRVKNPMAHLFIISDEFAELKAQQPEFMQQLITTARIGRSLGLHLILATQKPSGVVNDQIWSNSKFKVCLKVQDRGDSMEMLKRPEAASIKETGRFYLQVGYDDYFDIGQSGWGGAKYIPTNKIIKKIDDSITFINNTGYVVKAINDEVKKNTNDNLGDQLTNVVKYISSLSKKYNIVTKKLWLDKIPSIIYVDKLKQKYNYKPQSYYINPVIGEYDSPATQEQGLLNLDLTNIGNTIIYGQSGSGKENLLSTIMWSIMVEHTPSEVNMYVIDCGAETLKMFSKVPHVGEVVNVEDADKIYGIFEMAHDELERRKDLFADYAGSYINYCKNSVNKLPLIVIMINNYDNFIEAYTRLSEDIQSLYRECSKYGIVFIITTISTNVIKNKMARCFENVISLQLPNDTDYRGLLNSPKDLLPSKVFGRGIVVKDDKFYEFQTAYFCDINKMNNVVKMASTKLLEAYKTSAKKILIVPEKVGLNSIVNNLAGLSKVPIGYDMDKREVLTYNFTSEKINLIISNEMSEKLEFIYALLRQFAVVRDTKVIVLDFVNGLERDIPNVIRYNSNYDKVVMAINNTIKSDKESKTTNVYVLIGPGAMKTKLSDMGRKITEEMFMKTNMLENNIFVLVDDYGNIKNLKLQDWYQSQVNNMNGIWVGDGIGSQMAINISNLTLDDRKKDFAYMGFSVSNGKKTCIKCVLDEEIMQESEGIEIIDEE